MHMKKAFISLLLMFLVAHFLIECVEEVFQICILAEFLTRGIF